ncbi:MAG: hypothetical protein LBB76_08050 [Azoarcus sp.]|jgi:hemoglobin|nr:hypothetical protein [Azoarcus sp.]
MCQTETLSVVITPVPNSNPIPTVSHKCACGGHGGFAGRKVPPGHDLEYPSVDFPPSGFIAEVGETALRALVLRHHTLLRQHAEIGHLFARDDKVFAERVAKIADYIVEACGGPSAYSDAEGSDVCIRTRHFPFEIDERAREIWLEKLFVALGETQFSLLAKQTYWTWLEAMSIRMINRRHAKAQPTRIGFDEAVGRFG